MLDWMLHLEETDTGNQGHVRVIVLVTRQLEAPFIWIGTIGRRVMHLGVGVCWRVRK